MAHGGEVMTGKPVASIRSNGERVLGIVTAGGEEFHAPIVISAVDPCTTVLSLHRRARPLRGVSQISESTVVQDRLRK